MKVASMRVIGGSIRLDQLSSSRSADRDRATARATGPMRSPLSCRREGRAEKDRTLIPLIDLAHHVCSAVFGADTLDGPVATAYADAGAPFRYESERASRH